MTTKAVSRAVRRCVLVRENRDRAGAVADRLADVVLLVRKRHRPGTHLLTSNEGWEAIRGAFATRPGSQVDKRRVLLVR
jgi:predicted amidophosphoribosyltransferase